MNEGIYEEIVTKLVSSKLNEINKKDFFIKETLIDKEEAAQLISKHIAVSLKHALSLIKGDNSLEKQIEIANKIIFFLRDEIKKEDFLDDLIEIEGKVLKAVFNKVDAHFIDIDIRLKEITPYTRLTHSELFTGGSGNISLESELRKEILSSNRIDLLVSFIKWKGIIILEKELREFTKRGGKLRVISTTYMGASDYKAIELLSGLDNTEVKISYNNSNERLHAKAYLFYRNTGYHTGYIGSSNFSRSALTDGLEWNVKITTSEIGHVIDKFQKTFETYWQNSEFELFNNETDSIKLKDALNQNKINKDQKAITNYFDIKPYSYQVEILEKLEVERVVHFRNRNLVVAATGTGKTIISAFDFKKFLAINKKAKLLFIAHRKEILQQAQSTFRGVLRDNNFGELWVDGNEPTNFENIFASVQTLQNRISNLTLSPEYFDFIIIDEVHHIKASSYRPILNFFKPNILLGLTATPERMDGGDILEDFCGRIAAEIRLPEAMNRKLLCPFQYFGVSDSIDLSKVSWVKGKYVPSELTKLYTSNDRRVSEIISNINKYCKDLNDISALGFCISIEHAKFMTQKFILAGLKADYLTSENSSEREKIRLDFSSKKINYLFVVDIFNEGVDIPEIDTVLFLRPTESLTIFLQQLGRGLRLADNKDCLTVLDFVGNSRPEYDFENKFRALIGKTSNSVYKEIEDDFPHLPLGCSIVLEKIAKENILENIKVATQLNKNQLIQKIRSFSHQTSLPLTLKNFIEFFNLPIQLIYKRGSWKRLCQLAGAIEEFDSNCENEIYKAISNKWLSTSSISYFNFIIHLSRRNFLVDVNEFNDLERDMLLMLHYDIWQGRSDFKNLNESINAIGQNKIMTAEIIEVLHFLIDKIDIKELPILLPYSQPLMIHSRYTREQILVAFGLSTFEIKSSNREGVAENKNLNTEVLFIDLIKSEEDFSPSTMYNDFAINESLFHWQTQNATRSDTGKGLTYINHESLNKKILLFVREKSKDEFGNTMGYIFLGDGKIKSYTGTKPMNITWELKTPMHNFILNQSAKLASA